MAIKDLCPIIGCNETLPVGYVMCRKHWFMVPTHLQQEFWRALRQVRGTADAATLRELVAARDAALEAIDFFRKNAASEN